MEPFLEVIEDESGKYHYPIWWVMDGDYKDIAGPFDTEDAAVEAMDELLSEGWPCPVDA